ncbi:MAG: type II toxin-antitoxin system VapB family antitoxin [Bacillota bacterium]
MRTNIVIDDDLIEEAMRVSDFTTKKEVVNKALEEFVQNRSRKDLKELKGKIYFADEYDYKLHREGYRDDTG